MKKLITWILIIAIAAGAGYMAPKLLHTCDDCEAFFFGTGYEPNIIKDQEIICKDCAEEQHMLEIGTGLKDIEDFEKPLF